MKFNGLIVLATILAGTNSDLPPTNPSVAPGSIPTYTSESALRERFFDPKSVLLRNVEKSADGRLVCGEVNGRGRHGDYLGFQRFRVYGSNGAYMVMLADTDDDQEGFACN